MLKRIIAALTTKPAAPKQYILVRRSKENPSDMALCCNIVQGETLFNYQQARDSQTIMGMQHPKNEYLIVEWTN